MCIQLCILNISQIRMLNSEVTQPNMVLCCLKCPSKDWQHVHLPCFLSASCVPLPTLVGHLRRKQYPRWFHTNIILIALKTVKFKRFGMGQFQTHKLAIVNSVHSVETRTQKNSATCQCNSAKKTVHSSAQL